MLKQHSFSSVTIVALLVQYLTKESVKIESGMGVEQTTKLADYVCLTVQS